MTNVNDYKSCFCFIIFLNNGPIAWGNHKEKIATISMIEFEYIVTYITTKELMWM